MPGHPILFIKDHFQWIEKNLTLYTFKGLFSVGLKLISLISIINPSYIVVRKKENSKLMKTAN
jgi:hypothetical protein